MKIFNLIIMIEEKLFSLGVKLPSAPKAIGSYVPAIVIGNLVFVSGQIPIELSSLSSELKFRGKVGKDISLEDGQKAARLCTINTLAHLKSTIGSLDNINKFVKVSGFINCEPSFTEHHLVLNGASNFLLQLFDERGKHARTVVGMNSLPLNSAVEVDFVVEKNIIKPTDISE